MRVALVSSSQTISFGAKTILQPRHPFRYARPDELCRDVAQVGGSSPARTKDIGAMKERTRPARFPTEQIARNAPIATSNQFTPLGFEPTPLAPYPTGTGAELKQRGEQARSPPLPWMVSIMFSFLGSVSACMLMSRSRPERRRASAEERGGVVTPSTLLTLRVVQSGSCGLADRVLPA